MFNTFNKKKSFFYIIFAIFALLTFALGGSFLFLQNVEGVSAETQTNKNIEVVEDQKYVQHSTIPQLGGDSQSVFFYVSVVKKSGTGEGETSEQTLVENGKTYFVKDGETVVISFARRSEDVSSTTDPELPTDGKKELNTTATISGGRNVSIAVNGKELEWSSGNKQSSDHHYFLHTEKVGDEFKEGKYTFEIEYWSESEFDVCEFEYSVNLFKAEGYNDENGAPKVTYKNASAVFLNSETVAYERFFNYQKAEKGGFELPTLSYNPERFRVSISRQYEGRIYEYNFRNNFSADCRLESVGCQKIGDGAPDLDYDLSGWDEKEKKEKEVVITFKDLGTYNISYTYIYVTAEGDAELEMSKVVRNDILNIFGYQAFYSDYENDLTEFRSEKDKSFAADVTYKDYGMVENVLKDEEGTGSAVDISKLKIVSTNQAPVRVKFSASPSSQAYYKYIDGAWKEQTDQRIIFTEPGIYFAEFTYTFDGYKYMSDSNVIEDSKKRFTQKFLFEITTTTPIIAIKNKDSKSVVYSGAFTKENVVISVAPGTDFDSSVQVVVSKAEFHNLSSFVEIKTLSAGDCELSENGKYKIETKYGKDFKKTNVTYFTIDKEEISGLEAKTVTMADYTDIYVKNKTISDLFTNLPFTLSWEKKASGAVIKCDYQLIPLEKAAATHQPIYDVNGVIWISSGYELKWSSADINNFVPYSNTFGKMSVSGSEILNEAGLYLFKLTDEAGHVAKFYVFLDNSETRFLQKRSTSEGWEYFEPTALNNVSSDTTIVWGTHKSTKIAGVNSSDFSDESTINLGRLKDFYASSRQKFSENGGEMFFNNQIKKVWMHTDLGGARVLSGTSCVVKVEDGEQIYNFYSIDSANQKISVDEDKFNEFDTSVYSGRHSIKVSTDMSQSMLITTNEASNVSSDVELKQYGTAVKISDDKNLKNFHFTNKDVIYFALIKTIDDNIKVETISCNYYPLEYNPINKTYEYSQDPTIVDVNLELWTEYNALLGNANVTDEGKFYIWAVNIGEGNLTSAGKYVITRTYEDSAGKTWEGEQDYKTREFVFFVDRNPVLTIPNKTITNNGKTEIAKEVGEYIKMYVLAGNDQEVLFDSFHRQSQGSNKNDLNSISEILKTNKLPVKIFVPYAKYGYDNEGVFTTDSLNANINIGTGEILHPDLKLRVKVTFKNGEAITTTETTLSHGGYLDLSEIKGETVAGEYFVDIYDGMGNSWFYKFVISNESPSMDFVSITTDGGTTEIKTALGQTAKYTNADKLRVEWSDPQSEYLAKIDINDISYTINNKEYDVLPSQITEDAKSSKHYFVISQKLEGEQWVDLEDGDVIVVKSHFEGKEGDYPKGCYYFTRTITIDHTAPVQNLNKMIDSVLIKDLSDLEATRVVGKKFNKTIRDGDNAYISYAITSDFVFEFSKNTAEAEKIYYRRFDTKYEGEVKEVNLPTDPEAKGFNMFNTNNYTQIVGLSNAPKTTGLYEIVEQDSAGNYTVYTVFLYAQPSDVLQVTHSTQGGINETQKFEDEEADISVFQSFTLVNLDINGDHWFNLYITKEGETTSSAYRHTPTLADNEVFVGSSNNKIRFADIKFVNDTKYIIQITSRHKKEMKTLVVRVSSDSNRFDVKFVPKDNGKGVLINIQKDQILEIAASPTVEVGTLDNGAYVYEGVEYTLKNLEDLTQIDIEYDTSKLLRLSLPTNFSTTQYFFYIHGQKQVENEVTGEDLITTDSEYDYISSHDVNFTYDHVLYDVVVGTGSAQYQGDYVTSQDGNLTTLTLKAAAFTYVKGASTVGGDRTFTLRIRSRINSAESEQENVRIINIRINNTLPQVNLYNDYGDEQNILFSGGITRQNVVIKFGAEGIPFNVTICKKGESQKNQIESGHIVSDFATYEITCSLVGDRTASYTKYFTITKTELSIFAVITKDKETDENFEFLQPSKNYYNHNGKLYTYYITNKPFVDIRTDSSLNIEVDSMLISNQNGVETRLFTISNINNGNQNLYFTETIVISKVPKANQILTYFNMLEEETVPLDTYVSYSKIVTSIEKDTIENVRGNEQVKLEWNPSYLNDNNKILVTYLFEDQIVFEQKEIRSIVLSSSGKHTLIFEDMAGNKNVFTQNFQQANSFDFYFIRSVVFKINDKNTIDYAVYNGEVKISIPDDATRFFDASSTPHIVVKRGGEEIEVSGKNRTWIVSEPGFYEVYFLAKSGGKNILVEPVHFSIINPTESRLAYEYVGVEKYEIVSVLKGEEEIIDRLGGSGMRLFTATLADEKTGEGHYTVTVRAKRDDENLPVLDFSFGFWIHQANPPIVVSVEQGAETKNVINVQFNIQNLYDEVGDCYVTIGNMDPIVVEGANLSTMEELQSIDITSRGDYFIQVYTKSGNLVYSYRVIKKDPLNTVTIILICVGSAVLVALIIVFVKLRKRVKIR